MRMVEKNDSHDHDDGGCGVEDDADDSEEVCDGLADKTLNSISIVLKLWVQMQTRSTLPFHSLVVDGIISSRALSLI